MHGERGQATIEWVGLVLLAGLVLGGLAAAGPRPDDRGLGDALAARLTCAARGAQAGCDAQRAAAPAPAASQPSTRGGPAAAVPPSPFRFSRARVRDAFRRLRAVSAVAKRAWIVCLGYRRWRYELEHPLAPREPLPLGEALDIANSCLNPYAFLGEGWPADGRPVGEG